MHSTCLTNLTFCMRLTNCFVLTKKKSGVNFLYAVGCNFHCAVAPGFPLCSPRRCSLAKQITSMQDTSTATSQPNRPATLIVPVFTYQSLRAKWYTNVPLCLIKYSAVKSYVVADIQRNEHNFRRKCSVSHHRYRGADNSLVRPGRKQANVSVRTA